MSDAPRHMSPTSVSSMAKQPRKARGTAKNRVPVYLEVDPRTRAKIERVAGALGLSKAATLDLLLDSIAVDASGRPEFFEGQLATDVNEELPLADTA